MRKDMICVLFLLVITHTNILKADKADAYYKMYDQIQTQSSFVECLPSTMASCVVGAFTGGLTRYLERQFDVKQSKEHLIILMIMWWAEHKARHKVVDSLEEDFDNSEIPYKKNWMSFCAWMSSWVSYLHM